MIRDITIGQYYPADSVIHKLDPRTKLVGTIGFIVSVFLFHTFAGYAVATIFLAGMILLSKVPVKFIFKGLKTIFMLLLITIFFNNKGRSGAGRYYGDPTGLSGDRFFHYDIDDDA